MQEGLRERREQGCALAAPRPGLSVIDTGGSGGRPLGVRWAVASHLHVACPPAASVGFLLRLWGHRLWARGRACIGVSLQAPAPQSASQPPGAGGRGLEPPGADKLGQGSGCQVQAQGDDVGDGRLGLGHELCRPLGKAPKESSGN